MAEAPFGPTVARFDAAVDAWFDELRGNPVADRVFYVASALGDHGLIWHLAGLARAALPGGEVRDAVELSLTLGVESAVVNLGLKSLFSRARPSHDGDLPLGLRQPLTSSFPSGHACAAFLRRCAAVRPPSAARSGLLVRRRRGRRQSRVYVKVHHASDVVAGAAVGIALGAVAKRVWRRVDRNLLARGGVA